MDTPGKLRDFAIHVGKIPSADRLAFLHEMSNVFVADMIEATYQQDYDAIARLFYLRVHVIRIFIGKQNFEVLCDFAKDTYIKRRERCSRRNCQALKKCIGCIEKWNNANRLDCKKCERLYTCPDCIRWIMSFKDTRCEDCIAIPYHPNCNNFPDQIRTFRGLANSMMYLNEYKNILADFFKQYPIPSTSSVSQSCK